MVSQAKIRSNRQNAQTHRAKQAVRQAKLVQFSRFNPARSKVSLPAGMNMYA